MSSIMKVFLLLAVVVCISQAQMSDRGQQCLCRRLRNGIISRTQLKDVQVYKATIFCDRAEIVVTNNNGFRYCLNPKLKAVQNLMTAILERSGRSTTARTPEFSSTTGSTSSTTGSISSTKGSSSSTTGSSSSTKGSTSSTTGSFSSTARN